MKNKFCLLFLINILFSQAQPIYLPDVNFKNTLLNSSPLNYIAFDENSNNIAIDLNNNFLIEQNEALLVKRLFLYATNISDLTGIEYFTNLTGLSVVHNNLTNINVLNLSQLIGLDCVYNNLTTLDLSGLNLLNYIRFDNNNLTTIDFSNLINLKKSFCSNNHLTALDFSNNPHFEELVCNNNNLTSINIKNGNMQLIGSASPWHDCWNVGNPNLALICADPNEVAPLQSFMATCAGVQPTIDSSCALGTAIFLNEIFSVYPNPSNGVFNFDVVNQQEIFTNLEVYDILGKIVCSQKISDQSHITIDFSDLQSGYYSAKIYNNNKNVYLKLIKN